MRVMKILPIVLAFPTMNPSTIPVYNATHNDIVLNSVCVPLSETRESLPKTALSDYLCFCIETSDDAKKYIENVNILLASLKKGNDPLIIALLETFGSIWKYLQVTFDNQEKTLKILNEKASKNPALANRPKNKFVDKDALLTLEQFYEKYSNGVIAHIIEKYKTDFEKFKIFNIPKLLKAEFDFITCNEKYLHPEKPPKTMAEVISRANEVLLHLIRSVIAAAS